jgi:hypothetical protein
MEQCTHMLVTPRKSVQGDDERNPWIEGAIIST